MSGRGGMDRVWLLMGLDMGGRGRVWCSGYAISKEVVGIQCPSNYSYIHTNATIISIEQEKNI